jgi:hypothetical protein
MSFLPCKSTVPMGKGRRTIGCSQYRWASRLCGYNESVFSIPNRIPMGLYRYITTPRPASRPDDIAARKRPPLSHPWNSPTLPFHHDTDQRSFRCHVSVSANQIWYITNSALISQLIRYGWDPRMQIDFRLLIGFDL